MIKRLLITFSILIFGVSAALAAEAAPLSGKVVAIEGSKVQLTISGEAPKWLRKGAVVKLADESGKVVETAAKVSAVAAENVTITVKNADGMKEGDTLSLQKGRVMSGC